MSEEEDRPLALRESLSKLRDDQKRVLKELFSGFEDREDFMMWLHELSSSTWFVSEEVEYLLSKEPVKNILVGDRYVDRSENARKELIYRLSNLLVKDMKLSFRELLPISREGDLAPPVGAGDSEDAIKSKEG